MIHREGGEVEGSGEEAGLRKAEGRMIRGLGKGRGAV